MSKNELPLIMTRTKVILFLVDLEPKTEKFRNQGS